jgi:hypothetical protein
MAALHAVPAAQAHLVEPGDTSQPNGFLHLRAPWSSAAEGASPFLTAVRHPTTYTDHTGDGPWGGVDFYTSRSLDNGDLGCAWEVRAAHSGSASFETNSACDRIPSQELQTRVTITDDGGEIRTRYIHLTFPQDVKPGDQRYVHAGEVIGYVRCSSNLDKCQHSEHLMLVVQQEAADGSWDNVDLRRVTLDGQRIFPEIEFPGSRVWGDPIESRSFARIGDSGAQSGYVSEVDAVCRSAPDGVVTAVRDRGGNLKLINWEMWAGGNFARVGDSGPQAGRASQIALAVPAGPGRKLVTAVADSGGRLKLISWDRKTTGEIQRLGDSSGGGERVREIAMTRAGGKLITAVTVGSSLRLASWELTSDGGFRSLGEGREEERASHVAIASYPAGPVGCLDGVCVDEPDYLVITAFRTRERNLKVVAWSVAPNGAITRRGDSGDQAGVVQEIDVDFVPSTPGMFTVATSVRDSGGRLKIITWRVSASGATVSRLADSGAQAGYATLIDATPRFASAELLTAVRTSRRDLELIAWRIDSAGRVTRGEGTGAQTGYVGAISLCGLNLDRYVTSVRDAANNLKLIAWEARF